jgi:hypothetical protein
MPETLTDKRPFNDLRTAAIEVAETLGASFDESYTISCEQWLFERYEWTFIQSGDDSKVFTLSISGDDIDKYFRDAP